MKCMEIIEIRSNEATRGELKRTLHGIVRDINAGEAGDSVRIYLRMNMDSDFSLHLEHREPLRDERGSKTGASLAAALKSFGLIHHSVWIEATHV